MKPMTPRYDFPVTVPLAASSDVDLLSLRVVRAIADTGSVTAAAAALGYSQPAVSQHLRRLEARLGMAVVERVGRRIRLTDAGRVLARHATTVSGTLDAAMGELAELRGLRSGRVRLVGFPSASPTVVPRLIAELRERSPGIAVTYVEAEPPEAVAAVREDRADIALTFSYPGDRDDPHQDSASGLSVIDAGVDDLYLVIPDGMRTEDVRDLAEADWIAGCPRCRGHLLHVCERAGFAPRIAFETDNVAAVESLVARGMGVATLPGLAVASFPLLPGVRAVALPAAERRALHIVTAHGADRVPAVRETLRVLHAALGDAREQGGPSPRG
jgi:DNA-binding transcriptional LysR family regulator